MSEVRSYWVLFDATADQPYIKKMLPEGYLAFFDTEEDARAAKFVNTGTDYKLVKYVKASDYDQLKDKLDYANQVIDQRHGMLNQQAARIKELSGLLLESVGMVRGTVGNQDNELADRIDAAMEGKGDDN